MNLYKNNKRGQAMIFVIIAIVIALGIGAVFIVKKVPNLFAGEQINPEAYITTCARQEIIKVTDEIIDHGGFVDPNNFHYYEDKKVAFLCQAQGYFKTCINQHPMFLNEIKQEIINQTRPKVETCYQNLKAELEKRQNKVSLGEMNISVQFGVNKIFYDISRQVEIEKNEDVKKYDGQRIEVMSPLYELATIAMTIADNEAKYCYFEYVGYMMLHSEYNIKKFAFTDTAKVYSITDKKSGKVFHTATISCAMPAGVMTE